MMKIWLSLIFIILSNFANAHSLKVFAKQDGNFVDIKSYFSASSPCKGCEISIIKDGETIQRAKTNDKGTARIEIKADKFEIFVDGFLAHEKTINFTADKALLNQAKEQNLTQGDIKTTAKPEFDEAKESDFTLKFIASLAIIFAVFGMLYLVKRRR